MFHWKEFEKQGKSGIHTEQAFRHWQQEETGNANHLSAISLSSENTQQSYPVLAGLTGVFLRRSLSALSCL